MPYNILLISKHTEAEWSRAVKEAVASLGLLKNMSESEIEQLLEKDDEPDELDLIIVDASVRVAFVPLVQSLQSMFATARIVVVTASPTWKRAREAYKAGASDYFRKSFNIVELRKRLTAVLDQNNTPCEKEGQLATIDLPDPIWHLEKSLKKERNVSNLQVLIADNNADYLATRAEFLKNAGYTVLSATSPQQAEAVLANNRVHIALLDIRLHDDNDEQDTTGLSLAKNSAYRTVPKIMVTGFPSYQAVREALGTTILKGLPPAVQFLSKKEGADAMMLAVHEAVEKHVGINWALTIEWDSFLSFAQLAHLMQPTLEQSRLQMAAAELEDLFRKLFNHYSQITVGKLLRQSSGRLILSLFTYSENGQESQFIVSFGLHEAVMGEMDRFETAVPSSFKSKVGKDDCVQTTRYTAVSYNLHHCDLEEAQQFDAYLQNKPQERILNAIEQFYKTTLQPWSEQRRFHNKDTSLSEHCISSLNLDELHQPDAPQLLEKIAKLCEQSFSAGVGQIQQTASTLKFDCLSDPKQSLPHPITWNQQHGFEESSDVQWGLTHGAVGLDTILANQQGESWLIDFAQVGPAPLLIDFVALETAVKFQHLSTKNLAIRCHLEEALNMTENLHAATQSAALTPEGNTTLKIVQKIRTLASEITGANLATYQQALFYYSLAHLQQYDPAKNYKRHTLASFVHALLSAALIVQKIQATENGDIPPDAKAGSLWINNQEKEVWVEGKQITTLTPQDYQILHYFYQRAGKVCERNAIAEELNISYDDHDLLNSAISRLRKKVSPASNSQKYIQTVRGRGYRLIVDREM